MNAMSFLAVFFLLVLSPIIGVSQDFSLTKPQNKETFPLTITSDKVICEQTQNYCLAQGNVKALYTTEEEGISHTLTCDTLKVMFASCENKKLTSNQEKSRLMNAQKIEKIEAFDHVVVHYSDTIITGNKAVYNPLLETIDFFENVRIIRHKNAPQKGEGDLVSHSDHVVLYRKSGKIILNNDYCEKAMNEANASKESLQKKPQQVKLIISPSP